MEGQGGSFECIKQLGPPRGPLEGLGSIPNKIRIHANDDIYEATRNRMTEAEDKYKNKWYVSFCFISAMFLNNCENHFCGCIYLHQLSTGKGLACVR